MQLVDVWLAEGQVISRTAHYWSGADYVDYSLYVGIVYWLYQHKQNGN